MSGYEKQKDESFSKFDVTKKQLCDLFDLDNIKDSISTQKLKEMGGAAGLLGILKTNVERGLQNNNLIDKSERVSAFGRNDPIVAVFEDFMLRLISVAAIISLIIGICQEGLETGWMEGVTIIFAVVLIVAVSAGNDYMKEQQFAKLTRKLAQRDIEVIRDGKPINIPIEEILVGDIFTLGIGEILPIDGVLVAGSQLMMDESAITGESDLIEKNVIVHGAVHNQKENGFIVSGSKVMDGTGKLVVCAVGENSFNGKMKLTMQEEADPTPLQMKLETVANDIGKLGILVAALVIIALLGHLIYKIIIGEQELLTLDTAKKVVDPFLLSITIIVMAVPEGLPLAVTISLAYSVNKMKDEQNLVRTLASCEIMGGANNICSDKTGTLTQNIMTVTQLYFEGSIQSVAGLQPNQYNQNSLDILGNLICVNSQANPIKTNGVWEQLGNKTECALIALADQLGYPYQNHRSLDKIIKIFPFSSSRKRMIVLYQLPNNKIRVFVKGASEIILELCNSVIEKSGTVKRLDKSSAEQIENNVILTFAQQSLRTIGMAYKDIDSSSLYGGPENWQDDQFDNNLIFLGIAGIKDPLRPSIKHAIEVCKTAGITVRMVTGDNIVTAIAIAKECGILPENYVKGEGSKYRAMQGKEFREIVGDVVYDIDEDGGKKGRIANMEAFREIARDLRVLARSSPQDKYSLVTGLKQLDNVVAVTGDGTNDAPALKKADVGFAMGIAGTEVAKEAAGIILLDDNFNSIVTACKWGRNIFDSIRKFLQFQLTINIVALIMALVGSIILESSPLNAIQMLWVNLIMDTFAALALATEPPSESLLKRQPYGKKEYIVTPNMWRNIVGQAIYQIIILNIVLFMFPGILGIENSAKYAKEKDEYKAENFVHYTIFFQTFVLLQLFNQLNCRKLKREEINIFSGLCNNPLFWLIEGLTLIVQILLIELGGQFVKVSPLTVKQHIYCILLGLCSLVIGVFIKLIPNVVFNMITLFREVKAMDIRTLNSSATSVFRKSKSQLSETLIRKSSKEKVEVQPKWFNQKKKQ